MICRCCLNLHVTIFLQHPSFVIIIAGSGKRAPESNPTPCREQPEGPNPAGGRATESVPCPRRPVPQTFIFTDKEARETCAEDVALCRWTVT
ncbi:hypothetical protein BaRGS_00009376 [Batillaria attramentaria]|uniref:Uncharacterized protein n=1 Tax=Batillaria attramentaria TaxID=370345 RepID=A0ABD0LJD5_9CAEN